MSLPVPGTGRSIQSSSVAPSWRIWKGRKHMPQWIPALAVFLLYLGAIAWAVYDKGSDD